VKPINEKPEKKPVFFSMLQTQKALSEHTVASSPQHGENAGFFSDFPLERNP